MSAFVFKTTHKPTDDVQEDAIAQIDCMLNRAVLASLAYQTSQNAKALTQLEGELDVLLEGLESHTPVIRKKAGELTSLLQLFAQSIG